MVFIVGLGVVVVVRGLLGWARVCTTLIRMYLFYRTAQLH